jgi:hypothetical protein
MPFVCLVQSSQSELGEWGLECSVCDQILIVHYRENAARIHIANQLDLHHFYFTLRLGERIYHDMLITEL